MVISERKRINRNGKTQEYPKLYFVWHNMKKKCYNPANQNYHKYGAKGITVCEKWLDSFEAFLQWSLDNGYAEGLTLDRIDGERGYSPDNCRWVNYYIQEFNKGIGIRNTSGHKGVCPHGDRYWKSYISINGKRKHLGVFKDINQAIAARQKAEHEYNKLMQA